MNHSEFDSSDDDSDSATCGVREAFKIDWLSLPCVDGEETKIAISALPGCRFRTIWRNLKEDMDAIKKSAIEEVFVLLTPGELVMYRVPNLLSHYKDAGIVVHHWPTNDGTIPTIEDLMHMLHDMKLILQFGSNILIHCYGGLGRACFVAACLMLELDDNLLPEEVIETLRRLRGPGAIQTVKQYNFIVEYRQNRDSYLTTKSSRSLPL